MTRPQMYLAAMGATAAIVVGGVVWRRPSVPALLAMAVVCLIPGRVQGALWRDLFRGRDAITTGHYAEALSHFETFRSRLDRHPRLAWAIYLAGSAYTWNARAMVLHNVGTCHLYLGDVPSAEEALRSAVALDSGYALPLFNLAVIARLQGDEAAAESLRVRAANLGVTGGTRDRLLQQSAAVLAAAEGRLSRSGHGRSDVSQRGE